jgi:hypothetical protein
MKFAVRRESSSAGQVMHARKKAGARRQTYALATLNQQKPTGSPELGRSPFCDRPSRALPDPEEMPASDPSRPPVGPTVNDAPASHLLVPYIISRQARGERKASAGSQAERSEGRALRPAADAARRRLSHINRLALPGHAAFC